MDSEIFLSVPQIKLERSDSPIEVDTYFREGSPVNLHANIRETLTGMESIQSRNVLSSTRTDQSREKSWIDELLDFSSILSRQTQSCLNRIKCNFKRTGMQFDDDFRNHFLYIANNRIAESYDGFLIGLPKDMKSDGCKITKPNPNLAARPRITINEPNFTPVTKRKRLDEEPENAIYINPKVIQSVHSNCANQSILRNASKNESMISVKKVMVKKSQMSTSTTLTTSKLDDDVLFCDAETPKMNAVKDRKKSLDAARGRTDFYMFLAENRMSSPKNLDRRMTIGGPTVSIPTHQSNVQTKQRVPQNLANQSKPSTNENTRSAQKEIVSARSKSAMDRESIKMSIPISSVKLSRPAPVRESQLQMNMTLPTLTTTSNIMTRSRGTAQISSYKCNQCNYSTVVKTNLMRHNLKHTGEKPFICKFCEKGFTQKVNVLSHMRSNHHERHGDPKYWEL